MTADDRKVFAIETRLLGMSREQKNELLRARGYVKRTSGWKRKNEPLITRGQALKAEVARDYDALQARLAARLAGGLR